MVLRGELGKGGWMLELRVGWVDRRRPEKGREKIVGVRVPVGLGKMGLKKRGLIWVLRSKCSSSLYSLNRG